MVFFGIPPSYPGNRPKNKFEKAGVFFGGRFDGVSHHTFTTIPPRFITHFTTFCAPQMAKPLQKARFQAARKTTKYTAKDPDLSRLTQLAGAHTQDRPR